MLPELLKTHDENAVKDEANGVALNFTYVCFVLVLFVVFPSPGLKCNC